MIAQGLPRMCHPGMIARVFAEDVTIKTNAQLQMDVMEEIKWDTSVTARVALGAQNLYPEKEGAFSSEVSPTTRK